MQFDGHSIVTNFLERIEDLRVALGVRKERLHSIAIELFKKEALIWYRTQNFSSWDDLTISIRETCLPSIDLMEEIKKP